MDFEAQREANIAANKALLASLGCDKEQFVVVKRAPPKAAKANKRRSSPVEDAQDQSAAEQPARKIQALSEASSGGPRRSGRNAGKQVDYAGDGDKLVRDDAPKILTEKARKAVESEGKSVMDRKYDPKHFGSIPGVEVGTWWETRKDCSIAAIHAPWVAGISGGPDGCYSVALSGGYEDDVDLGEAFTYTGSGGRDLKGTKQNPKNLRTAPQSFDQDFDDKNNRALLISSETKKPVRVIRGYKLDSKYAPAEGYRYDGLYTVEKAWKEKGLNPKGCLVCKFAFKRIPGQPPLPIYEDEGNESFKGEEVAPDSSEVESETVVASEAVSEKED